MQEEQMSKQSKSNGKIRQYMVRVPQTTWDRVESQAKAMRKATGLTIPVSDVLRKCVSLGLAQLERGK